LNTTDILFAAVYIACLVWSAWIVWTAIQAGRDAKAARAADAELLAELRLRLAELEASIDVPAAKHEERA